MTYNMLCSPMFTNEQIKFCDAYLTAIPENLENMNKEDFKNFVCETFGISPEQLAISLSNFRLFYNDITCIHCGIRYEIEHTHIINIGNLTKEDFNDFLHNCKSEWENYFYSKITKEIHEYSEKELNELGFNIFTYIINGLKIKFKYDISFDIENVYVKNGSFLKLSNIESGFPTNSLISLSIFKSL